MANSISNSIQQVSTVLESPKENHDHALGDPDARRTGDPRDGRLGSSAVLGVLILGADFQALGILRALYEADIPTFLLANETGIASYSRFARRQARNQGLLVDDAEGVKFLLDLAREESLTGWAIACVDDDTVEFLARNHEALSKVYRMPVPDWEVTQHFFKKNLSYLKALEAGIPVPRQYETSSLQSLRDQGVVYPVVLKPSFKRDYYEKTKIKGILIRSEEELEYQYNKMQQMIPSSQIVVQEYLAGGTNNLYSFAALFDGEKILQGLSARRLRQHPMDFGHATTYAEVAAVPELEVLATRFLKAVGYRGVAEVEFMYDERTDEYKFLEMNGRFWGWHSLTYRAGLNLPRDLFRMLVGHEVEREGVNLDARWMRLLTDLPTLAQETFRRRTSPLSWLMQFLNSPGLAVWSWRDPLPFLIEVLIAPYLWWKKGF